MHFSLIKHFFVSIIFLRSSLIFCLSISLFLGLDESKARTTENPEVISSYPDTVLWMMSLFSRWAPSTQSSKECDQNLASGGMDPELCRLNLDLGPLDRIRSQIFFDYDVSDQKKFVRFTEQLNSLVTIRGLAAIHFGEKRPLAILRMGVHGNRDEVLAERFILKLLFEDLKMHVIMIENLTSHSYLSMNERVSFGGVEEGMHSFLILKRMQNGTFLNAAASRVDSAAELKEDFAWKEMVSSYHMVGLSLGGLGTFFTTWLDEQSGATLKSTLQFCPLVNLKENFENLSRPTFFNTFVDIWNWRRLTALRSRIENYSTWNVLWTALTWTPSFTSKVVQWVDQKSPSPILSLADIEKEIPNLNFDHSVKNHLENSVGVLALNDFWKLYSNEKTPMTIVTTTTDPLVKFDLNSGRIKAGAQLGSFKKTTLIELNGFHCALASEYEWPFLVEMVRRALQL